MQIRRRSFLGGAGALIGCSVGGIGRAQTRPPVTAEEFNSMVLREQSAPQFNCSIIRHSDEGPFYNPVSPLRRDISEGLLGVPMRLRIGLGNLHSPTSCTPMSGAVVDIWHADAEGQYSNVGEGIQDVATPGATFLRGHQTSDENGFVEFDTIVPGWEVIAVTPPVNFASRATHIHVKIYHEWRIFDTQVYLPDDLVDGFYLDAEPYRSRKVIKVPGTEHEITRLRNVDDDLYNRSGSTPMSVEWVDGKLVATAAIGMIGSATRGIPSFYGK